MPLGGCNRLQKQGLFQFWKEPVTSIRIDLCPRITSGEAKVKEVSSDTAGVARRWHRIHFPGKYYLSFSPFLVLWLALGFCLVVNKETWLLCKGQPCHQTSLFTWVAFDFMFVEKWFNGYDVSLKFLGLIGLVSLRWNSGNTPLWWRPGQPCL